MVAEEEPVLALRPRGAAFLEKRAERGDAGAGADHDDGLVAIGGQAEIAVRVNEHAGLPHGQRALGEEHRADALALAAVGFVADGADGKMDLAGMGLGR